MPDLRLVFRNRWTVLLTVLGACAFVAHCSYLALPVIDDAAITLAYGISLFSGEGLRLTRHSPPVEGFSSPLWTLLCGLCVPLGVEPLEWIRWLGVALGALSLILFSFWRPVWSNRPHGFGDALIPWVAAAVPNFAYWACSGMENGLLALCVAAAGLALLRDFRKGGAKSGFWLAAVALTRPEGVLYVGASGLWWLIQRRTPRRLGRQELRIALAFTLTFAAYLLFRWLYFASWLPNTYYAKQALDFSAWSYIGNFTREHLALVVTALLGAVVAASRPETRGPALLAVLFAGCVYYFSWHARGDWMGEWRFLSPAVPLFAALIGLGLASAGQSVSALSAGRSARWRLVAWGAFSTVVVVGLSGLAWTAVSRTAVVKASPGFAAAAVVGNANRLSQAFEPLGMRRPLVALADIGGIGLALRNAELMDVAGLADYAIARHMDSMAAQDDYLVSEGPPTVADAHGPSGHLVKFNRLKELYPGWTWGIIHLPGLSKDEDPRCPGGKRALLALSPQALAAAIETELRRGDAMRALAIWRCAFAYQPDELLPELAWRTRTADAAEAMADSLLQSGSAKDALRMLSLATVLDAGDAHRRRKTEKLRGRLFPKGRTVPY